MDTKVKCQVCGANEVIEEECAYYCERCGAQSQIENKHSQVHTTFYSNSKSLQIYKTKTAIVDIKKQNKLFSTYECAQIILKTFVSSIKKVINVTDEIDRYVGLVWINFLDKCGIFGDLTKLKHNNRIFDERDYAFISGFNQNCKELSDDCSEEKTTMKNTSSKHSSRKFIINSNTLLCILFAALKIKRIPVTYSDFLNWIITNKIPFHDTHNILPSYMEFDVLLTSLFSNERVLCGSQFYSITISICSKLTWFSHEFTSNNLVGYYLDKIINELYLPETIKHFSQFIYQLWCMYINSKKTHSNIFKELIIFPEIYSLAIIIISLRFYFYISWKIMDNKLNLKSICCDYNILYDNIKPYIDDQIQSWINWKNYIYYQLPIYFTKNDRFASLIDDNSTLLDHISRDKNNKNFLNHLKMAAKYKPRSLRTIHSVNISVIKNIRKFINKYTLASDKSTHSQDSTIKSNFIDINYNNTLNHPNVSFDYILDNFKDVLTDFFQPSCVDVDDEFDFLLRISSRYLSIDVNFIMNLINEIEMKFC